MPTQILAAPIVAAPSRAAATVSPVVLGLAFVAVWLLTIALVIRFPDAYAQAADLIGP